MSAKRKADFARQFLAQSRHSLLEFHLPRIEHCLKMLSAGEIWWRPHRTSNSIGNLVLHLSGNVRQWITAGLGGAPDRRERDKEFSERGPLPRAALLNRLRKTVSKASGVLHRLTAKDLSRLHSIQGFRVTGFRAISHVVEHFAYHTGQIVFVTKLQRGKDLGFTRLPGDKKPATKNLPVL